MSLTRYSRIQLLLWLLILSACQNASIRLGEGQISPSPSQEGSTINHLSTITPLSTEVQNQDPTPQSTPDIIQFSLPTPGAQPETAWRPPLYPVPWAASFNDHFYFSRPISVDQILGSSLDYRYGGTFFKPGAAHTGIDIPAKMGTPVLASGPGEVVWAGWGLYSNDPSNQDDPYGLAVVMRHDFGYHDLPLYTVYAHLDEVEVVTGQWLQSGDMLGKVGQTGFTTGSHLHFEVRLGENTYFNTRNPELWLVPPQGWGVLAARIADNFNYTVPNTNVTLVSDDTGTEWELRTYPLIGANGDDYYQENLVMSDLPAGNYTVFFKFFYIPQEIKIQIVPGNITYFSFRGLFGFGPTLPASDKMDIFFTPTP